MGTKQILKRAYRYIRYGIPEVKAKVFTLSNSNQLAGKKGIITGGSKGIGFAIAKKCISEGAQIIITGRNEIDLKSAKKDLGINCQYLVWDVQKVEEATEFIKICQSVLESNKLDFLVNNAGVSYHESDWSNVGIEGFEIQIKTNLEGSYFLSQAFMKSLLQCEDSSGNILFISSERGLMGDDIPYGLSKAAINSLVKGLARRGISHSIRINAIAPGVTVSNMVGFKSNDNLYRERSIGKRVFLPEEMAEVALFLLSDVSGCVTGEIIACDQGNYQRVR